jgi:iron complex outermembrane receptor protein
VDLQVRSVDYNLYGFRNNPKLTVNNNYLFFTPKAGITYTKNKMQAYISYARAAKEPNREDFETGNTQQPSPEYLDDFEAGTEYKNNHYSWGINFYYMKYRDQLALTGKINDVGAYTRTNIPDSYRAGIELQGAAKIFQWLSVNGNITFSENKIKNFTEYLDDYDNGGQQLNIYKKSNLTYSPKLISAVSVNFFPFKNAEINLLGKYVSKQYLDNTSNNSRVLKAYYLQDIRINYAFTLLKSAAVKLFVQANNIFSDQYEPNGYSYSYIYGGVVTTENYYLPMAPFNMMAGISIKL